MNESTPESVLQFTHGDPVAAAQLRRTLAALRDHLDDPDVARLAGKVLNGELTMREMVRDPTMLAALGRGMDAFSAQWQEMTPRERVALAERGKRDSEEMARDQGLPGEPEPAPVGEFGPALTEGPASTLSSGADPDR